MKPTPKTSVKVAVKVGITGYLVFPESRTPHWLPESADAPSWPCAGLVLLRLLVVKVFFLIPHSWWPDTLEPNKNELVETGSHAGCVAMPHGFAGV